MEKSIYEFDTARKVLDFLKDKKEIKIRIEASDEWMGFSQLVDNDGEKGDWVGLLRIITYWVFISIFLT